MQLLLAARLAPQLFARIWNGAPSENEDCVIDAGDGLEIVKVCTALRPPTSTLPKSCGEGVAVGGGGAMAVSVSVSERGLPPALSQM